MVPAVRVIEHQAHALRRFWRGTVLLYLIFPLMFLAAMGFGLGGLVDAQSGDVDGVSYLVFVAPGLMAATAMQAACADSLWPIMYGTKWVRVFHGMVTTPLGPGDVYIGIVAWIAIRATAAASAFLVVAAVLGAVPSLWAPLAAPAAGLCAAAFAAPLAAFAAGQDSDATFPVIMRIFVVPLFLFSGTFFPISQLPDWLAPARFLSPLWHSVELCRGATTGSIGLLAAAGHVAVLAACVVAGGVWGRRSFARRLTP